MKRTSLLNWFPAPNFLKMSAVGLDISDGSVRFIELTGSGDEKKLGRFGKIKLPEGVISNGIIKNKPKLVEALRPLKDKHGFNFVRVSIIETNSYIFKTRVSVSPSMSRREILSSLSFKIEPNVPMKIEDINFDFDVIQRTDKYIDVVVTALSKSIIDNFIEVLDEVGLKPLSFEVEAQAVTRSSVLNGDDSTLMLVDFRSTRVSVSIVSGGKVRFTSTLDIGGDDLIKAIKKEFDVSSADAKKIKQKKGILKSDHDDETFFAMVSTVSALKDEMNKFLIYWNTHRGKKSGGDKKVEKIILCGENGALRGLDDFLALSLSLKTERANVWQNILMPKYFIPEIHFFVSLEYAAAIGLAMRTGRLNLID